MAVFDVTLRLSVAEARRWPYTRRRAQRAAELIGNFAGTVRHVQAVEVTRPRWLSTGPEPAPPPPPAEVAE